MSLRRALPLAAAVLTVVAPVSARAGGTLLVDAPSLGTPLPSDQYNETRLGSVQAVSEDGRYVVFDSSADGLVSGDDDTQVNVYRKDLATGDVVLVSRTDGVPGAGRGAGPAISNDGSVVAFVSDAQLTAADTNDGADVYKRTITGADGSGTTTLVSCPISGACHGDPGVIGGVAVSGDGALVAWHTTSALAIGDTDGVTDVYARTGGTTVPVSVGNAGEFAGGGATGAIAVDLDGSRIAFATLSQLPVVLGSDTNSVSDVYVRDIANSKTRLISRSAVGSGGTPPAVGGRQPDIGDGGARVAFVSSAAIVGGDVNGASDVYTAQVTAAETDSPTLISTDNLSGDSVPAGGTDAALSGDGSTVAYLAAGPDGRQLAYVRPFASATSTLVSRASSAAGPPDTGFVATSSSGPPISLDHSADHAVFGYVGAALTTDAGPKAPVIYERSLGDGQTVAVSRPTGAAGFAAPADSAVSTLATRHLTSADDRYVLFSSTNGTLAEPSTPTTAGLFRRDTATHTTVRVDVTSTGAAPDRPASAATISDDGNRVAFLSAATDLVPGDTNGANDVFVRDIAAGTTTRVSLTTSGGQGAAGSDEPMISGDGTRVVFTTPNALDPAADAAGSDIYAADAAGGGVQLVSRATDATKSNGMSVGPSISRDGRLVAFLTSATNLDGGDATLFNDVYVRDLVTGTTTWASSTSAHSASAGAAYAAVISADGSHVLFFSTGGDMGDGGGASAGHVRDLATGALTWVTHRPDGLPATDPFQHADLSPDGTKILLTTADAGMVAGDTNGVADTFLVSLGGGASPRVATRADGSQVSTPILSGSFSGSGHCAVFFANDPAVVTDGYPSSDYTHVYITPLDASCGAGIAPAAPPAPEGPVSIAPLLQHQLPLFKDTLRPVLTKARLGTATFRVRSARSKKGRRARLGTTLKLTLSEDATLKLLIESRSTGRKVGKTCAKRTTANRRRASCTRYVKAKTLTARAKKGAVSTPFKPSGIREGRYRLTVTATDAAGNTSTAARLSFTVVR